MRPRRPLVRSAVAAGLLAVLALSGCSTPAPAPAPTTCSAPVPAPTLAPGSLRLPPHPSVLVFGDSYTQGYGAEPMTQGYAYLVGKPLGWQVTVDGVGGTGYVNPGRKNEGTYLDRLPKLAGRSFDLVVMQGSSNDRDVAYPALLDAISRTMAAVRAEFPGATVVILGTATPYGKPDPTRLLVQCTLAGYASAHYLAFLDPIGESWFVDGDGKLNANPDNGHPSNAGYRRIASRFEADMRVLLGTSGS